MDKRPPHGITELSIVVSNGDQNAVNVMGVVDDLMPPAMTRGKDVMLTFVLCDSSLTTNGCRFKYFKAKAEDLPQIHEKGDVVLLRNIRITHYGNELIGLSTYTTQHIIFSGRMLSVTRSSGASMPSAQEQNWARHLRQEAGLEVLSRFATAKQAPSGAPAPPTTKPAAVSARDKFALLKDVTAGERGQFYDLAGEVVKLFMTSWGYLDLYLCDYTVNKELHDYKAEEIAGLSGKQQQRRIPQGRMTLHVELHQPHAAWALGNVQEGDKVLLRNVRVKRSKGGELEGNLWQDSNYRDRVLILSLSQTDARSVDIQSRKTSYNLNVVQPPAAETKSSKKRKKRKEREAREAAEANALHKSKRRKTRDSGIDLGSSANNSDDESDGDEDDSDVQDREAKDGKPLITPSQAARNTANPNIKTSAASIPFSTINDMLNSDQGCVVSRSGDVHHVPFNNVKHHALMRVVDYYPHRLREFACKNSSASQSPIWQWRFWLVLEDAKKSTSDSETSSQPLGRPINVLVHGSDASELLGLEADNLLKNKKRLTELEQRLFVLWGELAEQKEKFLESNRGVEADESFSLRKYHIGTTTANRPFECCIAEYGVPISQGNKSDLDSSEAEWMRCFRMFDTKVKV